jgi:GNAT superfamily N-acetyltransferase
MMEPGTEEVSRAVSVRSAQPSDAYGIRDLYVRTYTPETGGDARDFYPFPQIMDPEKLKSLVIDGGIEWVVVEAPGGQIVASAAAVKNIGSNEDQIAEVFGIAVDKRARSHGAATAMLRRLVERLTPAAKFILCEARTAEAGGWKVARNAGFTAIGFEPYAHAMPIGFESMVLTGFWENNEVDLACHHDLALSNLAAALEKIPKEAQHVPASAPNGTSQSVRRDDAAGEEWFRHRFDASELRSSIRLSPLTGIDSRTNRFQHQYYVASTGDSDIAAAHVYYDKTDARARILGVDAPNEISLIDLISNVVEDLETSNAEKPLVIIICIRSEWDSVRDHLCKNGFFPTVFLPRFFSHGGRRGDAIQFTKLINRSLADSVNGVTALEWPQARPIIQFIAGARASLAL